MSDAYVKNAADPRQVKAADKKQKNKDDQLEADIRAVLKTRSGKNVLWHLMEFCKSFHSPVSGHTQIDGVLNTYMNLGGQNVGRYIMAKIQSADEQALFEMMKDNKENFVEGGSK